jgi:hypothetical protein
MTRVRRRSKFPIPDDQRDLARATSSRLPEDTQFKAVRKDLPKECQIP